jgi:hypothetical protein
LRFDPSPSDGFPLGQFSCSSFKDPLHGARGFSATWESATNLGPDRFRGHRRTGDQGRRAHPPATSRLFGGVLDGSPVTSASPSRCPRR